MQGEMTPDEDLIDAISPTQNQLTAGHKWSRGRAVRTRNIYRDIGTDGAYRYFIPSDSCLKMYESENDQCIAQFRKRYDSSDENVWVDADDFLSSLNLVRVIEVVPTVSTKTAVYNGLAYRCSCQDGVHAIFCRHLVGILLLEGKISSQGAFRIPGQAPQGCVRYIDFKKANQLNAPFKV